MFIDFITLVVYPCKEIAYKKPPLKGTVVTTVPFISHSTYHVYHDTSI